MTGDKNIMLALFLIGLITLLLFFVWDLITKRIQHKKQARARYKAYRTARRATAKEYAKQLQLAYIKTLYGGKK